MILDDIVKARKADYDIIKNKLPLEELKKKVIVPNKLEYRFYDLFKKKDFIYICECKHKSPSKGIIKENYNYLDIAKEYEASGADCISCLTEPNYFLGSDEHLINIKKNVSIPVLRKDFIFDEYQIYEAKLIGADLILLICAILDNDTLKKFINLAHSLGLSCLVETHNEDEINNAIMCGAKVIGVNNRNLKDFSVDNSLSRILREKYKDIILISESGIKDSNDVLLIKRAGLNGVLVGEALMKSSNISKTLKEFKDAC
ncbi:MAG: indole-3-glycerol phosphate synthase TrpC [Acholeplasmatales bacterium]|nr:indole-3-glycerol phosphate synthase TrpC [Acholeplasmatales bacterium]